MKILDLFEKSKTKAVAYLALTGFILSFSSVATALSCRPMHPSLVHGPIRMAESQPVFDVRSRMADSSLVAQGVVESISEVFSFDWTQSRLATIRPTHNYVGEKSAEIQVLVPITTQQNDEVVIFANLETATEIQSRINMSKSYQSTLKWTQDKMPLWVASAPCIQRTYLTKNSPDIVSALKKISSNKPVADVYVSAYIYLPGAQNQSNFDKASVLSSKTVSLAPHDHKVSSTQISQPLKDDTTDNRGFYRSSINNISYGKYTVSPPSVSGMNTSCILDFKTIDCASIELKPYAIHHLSIYYRHTAEITLAQLPHQIERMPIEYEFISLEAQNKETSKISYTSGFTGESIYLPPGKYHLFAVIGDAAKNQHRRFQMTYQGEMLFDFKKGKNDISLDLAKHIQPVETIVKWLMPNGETGSVYTSFQLISSSSGLPNSHRVQSSCDKNQCMVSAGHGQSIEIYMSIMGTEFLSKKTVRIGDQKVVDLIFTRATK
jgi:hypothetical protein